LKIIGKSITEGRAKQKKGQGKLFDFRRLGVTNAKVASRFLRHILPAFTLFLAMPAAIWAQAGAGSIAGTVHDQAGALVPNAAVSIANTDTNTSYAATHAKNSRRSFASTPIIRRPTPRWVPFS